MPKTAVLTGRTTNNVEDKSFDPNRNKGNTTQRQVLYRGEINDTQQQGWRRTLEVFDEDQKQYCE